MTATIATVTRRAIGYLRVSTGLQAEHGMGLEVQRDKVREHADREGFELVDVVQEAASGGVQDGETFSWEHRPILLDLLQRAEAGEFDVLLVAKLDRLSRDYATLIALERNLARHKVEVVSASEENGDGPVADYLRGNLALIAELERAVIRERLAAGKAAKKRLGRHVHGRVPYGYSSERGRLTPNEERAAIVRGIFADVKEGVSPGRIAKRLNEAGVPSPHGSTWTRQGVRSIVANPVYCGERGGVKKAHPAIISRRLFNLAAAAVRQRGRAG